MTYPGGKAGGNSPHFIINQIPPHRLYVEGFLGGGAIMRLKRPAERSIGFEIDEQVILKLWANHTIPNLEVHRADTLIYLCDHGHELDDNAFLYLDPPYLLETRKSQRNLYRHEMHSPDEHAKLLDMVSHLNCRVMISGYQSQLYTDKLKAWRSVSWPAMTRNGIAIEWLWMNYPEPIELHDYRFLGQNFREREKYKRQRLRWLARLQHMPTLKRYAMLAAIDEFRDHIARDGEKGDRD